LEIYGTDESGKGCLLLVDGLYVVNGAYECTRNPDGTLTIPHSNFIVRKLMDAPTNVPKNTLGRASYNDILEEAVRQMKKNIQG